MPLAPPVQPARAGWRLCARVHRSGCLPHSMGQCYSDCPAPFPIPSSLKKEELLQHKHLTVSLNNKKTQYHTRRSCTFPKLCLLHLGSPRTLQLHLSHLAAPSLSASFHHPGSAAATAGWNDSTFDQIRGLSSLLASAQRNLKRARTPTARLQSKGELLTNLSLISNLRNFCPRHFYLMRVTVSGQCSAFTTMNRSNVICVFKQLLVGIVSLKMISIFPGTESSLSFLKSCCCHMISSCYSLVYTLLMLSLL